MNHGRGGKSCVDAQAGLSSTMAIGEAWDQELGKLWSLRSSALSLVEVRHLADGDPLIMACFPGVHHGFTRTFPATNEFPFRVDPQDLTQ